MSNLTKAEILAEIERCSEDPVYFIRRYVYIEHPIKGIIPFDLFKFQERIIGDIIDNRFNILRKFRQAGVTTIAAAYSLWSIIFKDNHNVMVVSIGDRESIAFLRRVKLMYEDLPMWLKPKTKRVNSHELHLSTGSRVRAQPAGAGRGESVSHLIVDEAAFIDRMREFWAAVYPTISTGGKATLISTVNGMSNLYYELYRDADMGVNSFNVIDLHWREHPDYTEEWAAENRPIIGERMWLQEYDCEFLGTGETFIDRHTLRNLKDNEVTEYSTRHSNRMRIFKEPDPYQTYIMGVDSSFGRERDFSAFQIIEAYTGEQVAEFYSNTTPLSEFAEIVNVEGNLYNLAHVVVERNGLGIALIEDLFERKEYENMWTGEDSEFGIQITSKTKESVLSVLEEALRASRLRVNSERTVDELLTFIVTENGKVEADDGYHDDLVMSLALAAYALDDIGANSPILPSSNMPSENKNPYLHSFNTPFGITTNSDDDEDGDISWVIK
tara:strand:+ start:485 stop:1978 length:1494 start_codon:yes stop_codon:yes gene_type:complete